MKKVKVFYAIDNRVGIQSLEDAINCFFENNPNITVTNILQDASGRLDHQVTVTILYES